MAGAIIIAENQRLERKILETAQASFTENEGSEFAVVTRHDAQSGWSSVLVMESRPTDKLSWLCIGTSHIEADGILFDTHASSKKAERMLLDINASLKDLLNRIASVYAAVEDEQVDRGEGEALLSVSWQKWRDIFRSKPIESSPSSSPWRDGFLKPSIWGGVSDAVKLSSHEIPLQKWGDILKSNPKAQSPSSSSQRYSSFRPGIWDYIPDAIEFSSHNILARLWEQRTITEEAPSKRVEDDRAET